MSNVIYLRRHLDDEVVAIVTETGMKYFGTDKESIKVRHAKVEARKNARDFCSNHHKPVA